MKLRIIDELVTEVSMPVSADSFAEGLEEFGLAGKVEALANGRLHITIYQQECALDEVTMTALFNEVLPWFTYKLKFCDTADFDPEFRMSIEA